METSVKGYLKAYSSWAYTKQAMDVWAQLVRQRLDEMHGKGAAPDGDGEGE